MPYEEEKSHVSMGQSMCPACGKVFDNGEILLDRRLRNSLKSKTFTGYGLCPEHKALCDQGYIALVVCDESKSEKLYTSDGGEAMMKPEDAYRTGELIHIRKEKAKLIFKGLNEKRDVMFITTEAAEMLKRMLKESEEHQDGEAEQRHPVQ